MNDLKKKLSELGFSDEFLEFVDGQKFELYKNEFSGDDFASFNITQKGSSEYEISSVDTVFSFKNVSTVD